MKLKYSAIVIVSLIILITSIVKGQDKNLLTIESTKEVGQIEVGSPYVGIEIHKSFPLLNRISFYYPVANSIDISEDYWKRENFRIMNVGLKVGDTPKGFLKNQIYKVSQTPYSVSFTGNDFDSEISADTQDYQFELLSCSPELFFTFIKDNNSGKHHICTKPIKGTMPRGLNTAQDNAYKQQLIDSEKDRAENVMIVDLLRNDLGKYAKFGSVKVPQLFAIESFSNVHHMVSTITATRMMISAADVSTSRTFIVTVSSFHYV